MIRKANKTESDPIEGNLLPLGLQQKKCTNASSPANTATDRPLIPYRSQTPLTLDVTPMSLFGPEARKTFCLFVVYGV